MKLGQLLQGMDVYDLDGDPDQEIEGLVYDSRRVKPGYLFVALRGSLDDGHDYLQKAVQNGAVTLVAEEFPSVEAKVSKVQVSDSREALSKLATQFYHHPFNGMNLIGITGTNGKTTTSYLLEAMLLAGGATPGVIGTINYRFFGSTHRAPVTTPESLDLMHLFREMADAGVTDVIVEVSSHALDQKRTGDCPFNRAVFTNFSRDHLDYHHTMENYFRAKSLLFSHLGKMNSSHGAEAIINMDDPKGKELAAMTDLPVVSYGLGRKWDVRADAIEEDMKGLRARLITPGGTRVIHSKLLGKMNLYNLLAAAATAISLNIDLDALVEGIERLEGVPGRLELVKNSLALSEVVDYAHTPDALLNILKNLKPLVKGNLITVFGCGGDRDQGKRYEMGFIVGKNSNLAFITSDNPRSENPLSIIAQIEEGIRESGISKLDWEDHDKPNISGYFIEEDRRKAIGKAISIADETDLVLIAGKGHEDYQIIGDERRHFDDRKEAALAISEIGH